MAQAQDFTKIMQDMMGTLPVDMSKLQESFTSQAAFGEKMSKVALGAADKSAEVSTKWTKETIAKVGDVSKVKADPADYSKAMTDFASAQAEFASENLAAFAEIAKKVQMDTVELIMAAGKDISEDASVAVKKATADMSAAAKKATTAAK